MKYFDEKDFDFEKNLGKVLRCAEKVTNDKEEISCDLYVLDENEDKTIVDTLNNECQDKRFKWIYIEYTVLEDGLQCI